MARRTRIARAHPIEYEDHTVAAGGRYAYRLAYVEERAERRTTETWVEVPVALALALEGAQPNPAVGPLTVAFTLPHAPAVRRLRVQ